MPIILNTGKFNWCLKLLSHQKHSYSSSFSVTNCDENKHWSSVKYMQLKSPIRKDVVYERELDSNVKYYLLTLGPCVFLTGL